MWFTSDHHFWHNNIIEYDNRPFDHLNHMHYELIRRWKIYVHPDDEVYYLGDFALRDNKATLDLLTELPGKIIFVKGNHDMKTNKLKRVCHTVVDEAVIKLGSHRIRLSHYPYHSDHTEEDRYLDKRPHNDGKWLIHGHIHDLWTVKEKMINVGVTQWNYTPVHANSILEIINKGSVNVD